MQIMQSRRDFLTALSAAGAASVLGARASLADEGPPEVDHDPAEQEPGICLAPRYLAEDLLRAEGFTDIRYISDLPLDAVAHGELDFDMQTAAWVVSELDAGQADHGVGGRASRVLRAVCARAHPSHQRPEGQEGRHPQKPGSSGHLLLASIAAYVGLDPHTDIDWVSNATGDFMELFAERKVDAFLGFPPEPQELRARKIGHVILNTTTDKPWSQYFCCTVMGNRDFVRNYPVATKRVLRAVPQSRRHLRHRAGEGRATSGRCWVHERYDYALQTLTELPYGAWREFDPEDSMRFYALRLHEVGMIKSSPNALIADGTDWRFLNELKRELKA